MSALERMKSKLPANANAPVVTETELYAAWHQEKGWTCVTDGLPPIGETVYAYGYQWDIAADNLSGYMYRCDLGADGLWTYRPTVDDGRNNNKIFESHQIDFWRTIPEEEK